MEHSAKSVDASMSASLQDAIQEVTEHLTSHPDSWNTDEAFAPLRTAVRAILNRETAADSSEEEGPPSPPCASSRTPSRVPTVADAKAAFDEGRWNDAIASASSVLDRHPQNAQAMRVCGMAAMRLQDWTKARDYLSMHQSLDYDPDLEPVLKDAMSKAPSSSSSGTNAYAKTPSEASGLPFGDDFQKVLSDPSTIAAVTNMMQDESFLRNFQNSDLFKNLSSGKL